MLNEIGNYVLKQNEDTGKYSYIPRLSFTASPSWFDNIYEIPKEYAAIYTDSFIGEREGKFSLHTIKNLISSKLTDINSLEALYNLMSKHIYETHSTPDCNIKSFRNSDVAMKIDCGVFDLDGNILFEKRFHTITIVSDSLIACMTGINDAKTVWCIRDIITGEVLVNNVYTLKVHCKWLVSYIDEMTDSELYKMHNLLTGKVCGELFRVIYPSDTETKWLFPAFALENMEEGFVTSDDMVFHKGAEKDVVRNLLWCNSKYDNTIITRDLSTGKESIMPLAVAKSLGCPLLN